MPTARTNGTRANGAKATRTNGARAKRRGIIAEELQKAQATAGARYDEAARLFDNLIAQENFTEFLTLPAYDQLVAEGV